MSDKWYGYYDKVTGELKSTGTVRPKEVPEGLEEVAFDEKVDFATQQWDPEAKAFIAKPPVVKPFAGHMLFDRITASDMAIILESLGISGQRAAELTADHVVG